MIFGMNLVLKVLISNLILVFENLKPKPLNLRFWVKTDQLFNLNEVLPVPCFGMISNLTFVFENVLVKFFLQKNVIFL